MSDNRGKKRTRRLTDDERALWDFAARSMSRLERAKGRVHPSVADETEGDFSASPNGALSASVRVPDGKAPVETKPRPEANRRPPVLPPYVPPVSVPKQKASRNGLPELSSFDSKSARRIRGGRTEIDARLDLHGMRQDEARAALVSFLRLAQARGHRFVLVITGKGAPRRSNFAGGEVEPWSPDRPDPPGVLRRNVPVWLASPDMRSLVVSYTEAAIQHGGAGALYVQVRIRG